MATKSESRLSLATRITTILTLISVIVGIAIGVNQLHLDVKAATGTFDAFKPQTLQKVRRFLDQTFDIPQPHPSYLRNPLSQNFILAQRLLKEGRSGEELYYSDNLESYRRISSHYERLGAILDLGYL